MEAVGVLGNIKLTTLIIRRNLQHFLCLAVLWVIAFCFDLPVLDTCFFALETVAYTSFAVCRDLVFKREIPPAPSPAALPSMNTTDLLLPKLHLDEHFPIIASIFFSIIVPLLSQALLAYSVCRACLNKSISLKGSLLGVSRSAKSLAFTWLCMGIVVLGVIAMAIGMFAITAVVVVFAVGLPEALTSMSCMLVAMGIGGVYISISFSLANAVATLEEKPRGWGAMKRSMDLLAGRKWVALAIVCVFFGLLQPFEFSGIWRWRGARIVRVSLKALVCVGSTVSRVVLYMSCKRQREEPLHTLVAAGAQFGPTESSPKSMDVETPGLLPVLQM